MRSVTLAPTILALVACLSFTQHAQAQEDESCPTCLDVESVVEEFGLREGLQPVRERPGWHPPKVVVTMFGERAAHTFRLIMPDAEVIGANGMEAAAEVVADADLYIGRCHPDILANGKKLKWVATPFAGAEDCTALPEFAERDILLTNMRGIYGPPIAQHAIALTLALANKLYVYRDEQAAREWSGFMNPGQRDHTNLGGELMLVVGLGGIGTEIARLANGLGMRVTATRRSRREGPDFVEHVGLSDELHKLAAEATVVVSALPLTDETRGVFDEAFFNIVPEGALFVNIGRGELVVNDDLIAALRSGHLGGAALDVTDPEPLPPDHPLWSEPRVILTPHVANSSDMSFRLLQTIMRENMQRYSRGDKLLNVVDIQRGY